MTFLITGGAGSVGRHLTLSLLEKGHRVRVLDRDTKALRGVVNERLQLMEAAVEDRSCMKEAVEGVEVIIHLAWSFSENPLALLDTDLKGHIILLEEAETARISHLFYASTAVVYGKPLHLPVTEESPCLVEDARKPFYGIAKLMAEKLALSFWKSRGLPVSIFRFWWSFGQDIGGKHLRELISISRSGQTVFVPGNAGGSFLHLDDLAHAILLAVKRPDTFGEIFNLSSLYLSWEDVGKMVIEVTASQASLEVIAPRAWSGAQFLADSWELSAEKAKRVFHYHPLYSFERSARMLKDAITLCSRNTK